MAIRTQRPMLSSQPGRLFLIAVLSVSIVTLCIPYSPIAKWMGFVRPNSQLLMVTIGIAGLYAIGMELVKRGFYRYLAPSISFDRTKSQLAFLLQGLKPCGLYPLGNSFQRWIVDSTLFLSTTFRAVNALDTFTKQHQRLPVERFFPRNWVDCASPIEVR